MWNTLKTKHSSILLLCLLLIGTLAVAHAAVELTYFTGQWNGENVELAWGTASEGESAGFYVWRSTENLPVVNNQIDTSQATRLNDEIIVNPAGICNPAVSHDYTFIDDTADENEDVYYYYLENLNCDDGGSEFYGDGNEGLQVQIGVIKLYLSIANK